MCNCILAKHSIVMITFFLFIFYFFYRMSQFMIIVFYGGKWVNLQYTSGRSKSMIISNHITYQELVKELYHRISVSSDQHAMKLYYQYKSNLGVCSIMEIVDNEDVASWVCDSFSVQPDKIPLYITLECSLSRSVSGSTQSMNDIPDPLLMLSHQFLLLSLKIEVQFH